MSYAALAIDLDGTLLVGEDLTARNRDAVAAAHAAGFAIIIATARRPPARPVPALALEGGNRGAGASAGLDYHPPSRDRNRTD